MPSFSVVLVSYLRGLSRFIAKLHGRLFWVVTEPTSSSTRIAAELQRESQGNAYLRTAKW